MTPPQSPGPRPSASFSRSGAHALPRRVAEPDEDTLEEVVIAIDHHPSIDSLLFSAQLIVNDAAHAAERLQRPDVTELLVEARRYLAAVEVVAERLLATNAAQLQLELSPEQDGARDAAA